MSIQDLKSHLEALDQITNDEWQRSLDSRKVKELEFHDRDRDRLAPSLWIRTPTRSSTGTRSTTRPPPPLKSMWTSGSLGTLGARYSWTMPVEMARTPSRPHEPVPVWPLDSISARVSVANARDDARAAGVESNTFFVQADAENTRLPDNSVDAVICSGMLHHLDLSYAFPELRRILAPGGRLLAVEALDYNPAIKLYRWRTPAMRTEWEKAHILSLKDVTFARRFFTVGEMRFWHILSLLGVIFRPVLPLFNLLDRVLTKLPIIKYAAWIFTFELIKPDDNAARARHADHS